MTGMFTSSNEIFAFLFGFFCIFIGDFIIGRSKSAKTASPFVRFLLATAFTYIVEVIKDIIFFLSDYLTGTSLQGYNLTPAENILFFKIFGSGKEGIDQYYPLFFINISFIDMMLGCAIAGGLLWIIRTGINKKKVSADE